MKEGEDQYFLTDTCTGHHDNDGHVMRSTEKNQRNEFLQRQGSRWRWLTKEDREALTQ